MPRLTTHDYLTTRRFLVELLAQHAGNSFAALPTTAQHDLHDFYAPSVLMSDDEALKHRKAMTAAFPSLPQSAGRAASALQASVGGTPNQMVDRYKKHSTATLQTSRGNRTLRMMPVAKPQLDEYHLIKVIEHLWREEAAKQSKPVDK